MLDHIIQQSYALEYRLGKMLKLICYRKKLIHGLIFKIFCASLKIEIQKMKKKLKVAVEN